MTEQAHLLIKVSSDGAVTSKKQLDDLTNSSLKTERATNGMAAAFRGLVAPILATVSATAALSKLINVQREFDKLNASLITSTGSAKNASAAFLVLKQFAEDSPFNIKEVTEAFNYLVNTGLNPSIESLTAYGDIGAATGKSISDVADAINGAINGQYIALKSLGIRAKEDGNNIVFTFRGVTKSVKNSRDSIEEYFRTLSKSNFSGAMAEQTKGLNGAINNLGDAWDNLFLSVNDSGIGDLMAEGVRIATGALNDLTEEIKSGELLENIQEIGIKFDGIVTDIKNGEKEIETALEKCGITFELLGIEADELGKHIKDAFVDMPENIRTFVKVGTVETLSLLDKFKNLFEPDGKKYEENYVRINQLRQDAIQGIFDEKEADDSATRAKIDNLRKQLEELNKNRPKPDSSILGKFDKGGNATGPTEEEIRALEKYQKHLEALLSDTNSAKAKQITDDINILNKAIKDGSVDVAQATEKIISLQQELGQTYIDTGLDGQSALDALSKANEETSDEVKEMWVQAAHNIQDSLAEFLFDPFKDGLSGMVQNFGIAIQHMIANAAAAQLGKYIFGDLSTGASSGNFGLLSGIMGMFGGGGYVGSGAGIGAGTFDLGNLGSFSGTFANGGTIPAGRWGIAGEGGRPEIVRGPASVISGKDTAKMMGGHTFNFSFGAGTTESDGRKAGAAAAREVLSALSRSQRYG